MQFYFLIQNYMTPNKITAPPPNPILWLSLPLSWRGWGKGGACPVKLAHMLAFVEYILYLSVAWRSGENENTFLAQLKTATKMQLLYVLINYIRHVLGESSFKITSRYLAT